MKRSSRREAGCRHNRVRDPFAASLCHQTALLTFADRRLPKPLVGLREVRRHLRGRPPPRVGPASGARPSERTQFHERSVRCEWKLADRERRAGIQPSQGSAPCCETCRRRAQSRSPRLGLRPVPAKGAKENSVVQGTKAQPGARRSRTRWSYRLILYKYRLRLRPNLESAPPFPVRSPVSQCEKDPASRALPCHGLAPRLQKNCQRVRSLGSAGLEPGQRRAMVTSG